MHHFPQMQHNPVSDTEKYKTTALLQFLNLKWQPTVTTEFWFWIQYQGHKLGLSVMV